MITLSYKQPPRIDEEGRPHPVPDPRYVGYGRVPLPINGGFITVPRFIAKHLIAQGGLSEQPADDCSDVDVKAELATAPEEYVELYLRACGEQRERREDCDCLRARALKLHDNGMGPKIRKKADDTPRRTRRSASP